MMLKVGFALPGLERTHICQAISLGDSEEATWNHNDKLIILIKHY